MVLESILSGFIGAFLGFVITIISYNVITLCVNKYRWLNLKRHVIEAIEELNLWDKVNAIDIKCDEFLSITRHLDAQGYKHCFYEHGGAFLLMNILSEIRTAHEADKNN